MYLSNAEKEALQLTGFGDVPPWAVEQGLEQALGKGAYIPGEESLRLRLTDALDLEERLAAQQAEEAPEQEQSQDAEEVTTEDQEEAAAIEEADAAVERHLAAKWPSLTLEAAATEEDEEATEEPPADQCHSRLEIVTEGVEEAELDATPAAEAQQVKDCDFSSFTKTELVTFAADMFGIDLDRRESRDRMIARVQGLVDEASEKAV